MRNLKFWGKILSLQRLRSMSRRYKPTVMSVGGLGRSWRTLWSRVLLTLFTRRTLTWGWSKCRESSNTRIWWFSNCLRVSRATSLLQRKIITNLWLKPKTIVVSTLIPHLQMSTPIWAERNQSRKRLYQTKMQLKSSNAPGKLSETKKRSCKNWSKNSAQSKEKTKSCTRTSLSKIRTWNKT